MVIDVSLTARTLRRAEWSNGELGRIMRATARKENPVKTSCSKIRILNEIFVQWTERD